MHMTAIKRSTSGHGISPKKYTHVQHRNYELKHDAHRLVQHTLRVMWRWHGQIKAISFLACATSSPHHCSQKRSESSDRNCELGNEDKQH